MKIGIDLSPLQNAHRMRGIGYTLIHFLNNLPAEARENHSFVFYTLPAGEALFADPLELIDTDGLQYELRELRIPRYLPYILPGRLNIILGIFNRIKRFREFYFNVPRFTHTEDLDVFLQADQSAPLPKNRRLKKALVIYDLIPYILEADYWWSYSTARKHGRSRLRALHFQMKRTLHTRKVRVNTKRADVLLAISELTKHDFMKYLAVPDSKIAVTLLGVTETKTNEQPKVPAHRYIHTGWGYIKRPAKFDTKTPYLLYVGGADSRRKLEDVIAAFNNLRAQGHELRLVLAGDIMLGPKAITNPVISHTLQSSSYLSDIVFLGFIDDATRDWLYENALAYVFPSRYEGFGLPVLEAMAHGCPVISYRNHAVYEVAGDAPIYTQNTEELMETIKELMTYDLQQLKAIKEAGYAKAKGNTWTATGAAMFKAIVE